MTLCGIELCFVIGSLSFLHSIPVVFSNGCRVCIISDTVDTSCLSYKCRKAAHLRGSSALAGRGDGAEVPRLFLLHEQ